MQLTPFGRLDVKIEDLPTITDDPRKTAGTFEKLFTKKEKRQKVEKSEPGNTEQSHSLPPNTPNPGLAPIRQPPTETPEHIQTKTQATNPDTPTTEGEDEAAKGDTLSFAGKNPATRRNLSREVTDSKRLRPTSRRTFQQNLSTQPQSFSDFQGRGANRLPGAKNQGVKGVERSGSSNLSKSSQNKSREAKDFQKPKETRAGYRGTDPQRAELAKANRDSIFRQVTMALTQEGGSMFLAINPPSLGHIALELKLDGDKLRLKIRAEHKEVTDSLRQEIGELKKLLLSQGMNVEDFDVRTGTQQEQARDGENFEQSFRKTGGRAQEGMNPASSPETHLISPLRIQKGAGIDFIA